MLLVTIDFEAWLQQVAPRDELDPGIRPAGADELLRDVFHRVSLIGDLAP